MNTGKIKVVYNESLELSLNQITLIAKKNEHIHRPSGKL